jgi:lysyl-tRNA synthetase class 2
MKLRKRYLDILLDPKLRDLFVKKSKFWNAIRSFLLTEGFLEVETPVLENTTGGADARPFATHHNALDLDVYLRISCGELWQKRLMVAGYDKVFEIGRIFRNEGISPEHAQDYTQLEFYWGYANFEDGMALVERMYRHVAKEAFGTLEFTIGNFTVDLGKKWERYDYRETIKEYTDIDISTATLPDIEAALKRLKVDYDKKGWNKIRAIDTLWKYCRKKISGPGFLVNVPVEMSPLAKLSPDGKTVEQFQPIIAGSEVGKGYSELNDPIDQAARFQTQQDMRDQGDDEAQMFDREFVEALEHGMPPTCGFGVSERLFAFLANKPIREAQLFPLMRPKI